MRLCFILLVLKQVNAVVAVTIQHQWSICKNMSSWCCTKLKFKVFNLMSRTNETRHIKWHKRCKCKCKLDARVCNNKQRWNDDKWRCECKEIIDKGVCDKEHIWNPSNCECECDKSCNVGEYLDGKTCRCRKRLADKLVKNVLKLLKK